MQKLSKLFFILIVFGFIYLVYKSNSYDKEIAENPGQTICKYTFCKSSGKSATAFVKYCIDDKRYRSNIGRCPDSSEFKINKYYVLTYSKLDVNKIKVDFSNEIKDTILIKNLEAKLTFQYWLDH